MDDEPSSEEPPVDDATLAAKEKAKAYVGQLVGGRYLIEDIIAFGGMGAVFRAEHIHMRKRVALKLLHPWSENLPELVQRFERESIVGSHVAHPNVCSATDFGRTEDGSNYLVLEYVEGRTLGDLLKDGPVPPARAAEIARQIALGLGAAHELGIYHRDVKPSNMMLSETGRVQVKIVDFGLAKLPAELFRANEQVSVTAQGTVFGTVAYMAPELARGMQAVDHRSDFYALGIMFFEMLAGKHPFEETAAPALFRHHRFTVPPAIVERAPNATVPAKLEAIVRKLIEKDPSARYQSANELIDALDEASPPESAPARSSSHTPISQRPVSRAGRAPIEPPDRSDASAAPSASSLANTPAPRRGWPLWIPALAALGLAAGAVVVFAPQLIHPSGTQSASPQVATESASPSASIIAPVMASATPAIQASSASPTTSAVAAIEPAPTASAEVASPETTRLRGLLHDAATARDAARGAQAITALAKESPSSFHDRDVVANAASVAVTVELGDHAISDEVFGLLGSATLGDAGPDVLFYITSFYGGSRGATRATTLLAKPDVLAHATPALRIAREMKNAACKDRPALIERAVSEGDDRALAVITTMLAPACTETPGACCASFDLRFTVAAARLRERLRK